MLGIFKVFRDLFAVLEKIYFLGGNNILFRWK